jgi:hypothetical protein
MKTARTLGIEMPLGLLSVADDVIEESCCLLQRMSLFMARSCGTAASTFPPLARADRTSVGRAEIDAFDPTRTLAKFSP